MPTSHQNDWSALRDARRDATLCPDCQERGRAAGPRLLGDRLRRDRSKNVRWEITVQPSGNADVTVALPVSTG